MTYINETHSAAYRLARVRGRSIGSLFFSVFGALWLSLGAFAFRQLTWTVVMLLAGATLVFITVAVRLLRSLPKNVEPDPQRERDGRRFGWVNAGQGAAIFLALQVANNLHHPHAAFPAIALIVGLHFFLLPRSFRVRSNLITGAVISVGAVLCPLLFHGNTMIAAVSLWAGVTLWCSAAWALTTAFSLYKASRSVALLVLHGAL